MKKLICIVLAAAMAAAAVSCVPAAIPAPAVDAGAVPAAEAEPSEEPRATETPAAETAAPEETAPADDGVSGVGVTRGNSAGNTAQGGLAVQCGTEVYYAGGGALYRQDAASGVSAEINGSDCKYINVAGDTLWCIDYGAEAAQVPEIVSMKTDGSGKTELVSGYADNLSIVDGFMYYLMLEQTDTGYCSTPYRAGLDGSGAKALLATGTDYRFLNVVGDWVYLTDYVPEGGGNHILRVSTEGGMPEQIATVAGSIVRLIAVGDRLLCAANVINGDESVRTLTAFAADGVQLWQAEGPAGVNADAEYIYYIEGGQDGALTLNRMDWECGGKTLLAEVTGVAELWLTDDAVVISDGTAVYTVPKAGGEPKELLKVETEG